MKDSPWRRSGTGIPTVGDPTDWEREFGDETTVNASGTSLKAEATWPRLGVNGTEVWGNARYALRSGASYAATSRVEICVVGGELNMEVRF